METGDVEITPPQHRRLSDFWPSWRDFALDGHDYRAIFLFSGCFVYALFGSPTPEHPGPAEALICFFLALAIGLPQASAALVNFSRTRSLVWRRASLSDLRSERSVDCCRRKRA